MKKGIFGLLFICLLADVRAQPLWISTDAQHYPILAELGLGSIVQKRHFSRMNMITVAIDEKDLHRISRAFHQKTQRCGGFLVHQTPHAQISPTPWATQAPTLPIVEQPKAIVFEGFSQLKAEKIEQTILHLSAYHNRYYTSQTGEQSAYWIFETWSALAATRDDVEVNLFKHDAWRQPSVVMKIKGRSENNDGIVLGGHLDSIAGYFNRSGSRAPGADDNASGIATITEVARVFLAQNRRPEVDIYLMGYAAEEVGLRGSQEIAQLFKQDGIGLRGVMQLDMTNYPNSAEDITFIRDYTDNQQTEFVISLLQLYLPELSYNATDRCGYACSDHASWYNQGYATVMPFETRFRDINPFIHTNEDDFAKSGHALHALKFAKLAYAWVVELSDSQ